MIKLHTIHKVSFLQGFTFILFFTWYGSAEKIHYTSCTAHLGTPTDVRISGCTGNPCKLMLGSSGVLEIDFTLRKLFFERFYPYLFVYFINS